MKRGRLVVVDWTRSAARVGVFADGLRGWQLEAGMDMPASLGVRSGEGGPCVLIGDEATEGNADSSTLIFDPVRDLPRMDDSDLQNLLLTGFWRAVVEDSVARGLLRSGEQADGYVVPSHRFPLPLLNRFRESCAGQRPVSLVGIVNEAAAFVLGFLRSEACHLESSRTSDPPITICLVVALEEHTVDVACFDYQRTSPTNQRILIRDFFHTTCTELSTRLRDCDRLGGFSEVVVVEDPALPLSAQSAVTVPLQAIADGVMPLRHQTTAASQFKLSGAAYIALCASRRAPDAQGYALTHACHIGLQVDQQYFQPVVAKDAWAEVTEFPHVAAQTFRLHGRPGAALRLNLCSSYSTRVADAVPLGHMTLSQEDLAQLTGAGSFTAAVRLDAPGSGEFLLGLMPENRVLRRQAFTLPGLVV